MLTCLHQPFTLLLLSFGKIINKAALCPHCASPPARTLEGASVVGLTPEVQPQSRSLDLTVQLS